MSESVAIPHDQLGNNPHSEKPDYDPTPEEQKAIKLVEHCYQKAKQARSSYDQNWVDYYRMFRGRQWKDNRPSYRHSEVINLVFRAIQSEVPIMMDTRPKIEYVPTEPGDLELSSVLNEVLECDWNDGNWLFKLTEMAYDSRFYGTAMGSVDYDPKASFGVGRITFDSEDPFFMFPDPAARDVNVRANYIVKAEPLPVDVLKRKYPDHAEYIKADLLDLSKYERENWQENIRYRKAGDSRIFTEGSSQYNLDHRDEALELILYIKDYECIQEEIKEVDKEGIENVKYIQKLKYPLGRKIVTVGGVLVEDRPIEFEDGKFPYVRLVNYILPREFWGISEIEQLESPQKIFNKLVSFALDVLTLMGNPIWIVDTDSGVDTDNLFNRPGLVIEKAKGSEVRREEGVHLQPYVLTMINEMKLWFDDISGSNDVSRGQKPEGVTAASAITALQEAQQTRTRQKARNMDATLTDFGKMYASRVFQFYDAPRIFRVTGQDNSLKYFKFHIDKEQVVDQLGQPTGETRSVAKVRTIQVNENGEQFESEEKAYQVRGEFDVRVISGSGLPFEKARIESQSFNLFDRGIIDGEEVLKNIKYANAPAVLSRMAEKARLEAEAQMQSQMQQQAMKAGALPPAS